MDHRGPHAFLKNTTDPWLRGTFLGQLLGIHTGITEDSCPRRTHHYGCQAYLLQGLSEEAEGWTQEQALKASLGVRDVNIRL